EALKDSFVPLNQSRWEIWQPFALLCPYSPEGIVEPSIIFKLCPSSMDIFPGIPYILHFPFKRQIIHVLGGFVRDHGIIESDLCHVWHFLSSFIMPCSNM
ncbi:unnamed protein product, partial [Penicillium nalgiovense]